jgi:catalase
VNYQPSTNLPKVKEDTKFKYSKSVFAAGITTAQATIDKENNFAQAGDLYRSFSKKDQDNLIKNLSGALNAVKNKVIIHKMLAHFYQADKEYGTRLIKATNTSLGDVQQYIQK